MSAASVLARGRALAEKLMTDRCTIRRAGAILYAGQKCRVQDRPGTAREAGDAYVRDRLCEVQLPVAVAGLQVGDELTIDAAARDSDLVGKVFRIQDLPRQSHGTARRLACAERAGSSYLQAPDDREWTP